MKAIILDHDIGTNPDDFFSLLLLLNSSSVDLKLTISGNNFPFERARFAHRIIRQQGMSSVPIYAGEATGQIEFHAHSYIADYETNDISPDYIPAIKTVLDEYDDVTYLAIQGLSNLAQFLKSYPTYANKMTVVHMGAKVESTGQLITGGTNMEADALAAKYVYEYNLPKFKVVGSHTTISDAIRVHPDTVLYQKLQASSHPNHQLLLAHLHDYYKRRQIWPALHDPLTTTVAMGYDFVTFSEKSLLFEADGAYRLSDHGVGVMISDTEIKNPEAFMELMVDLV